MSAGEGVPRGPVVVLGSARAGQSAVAALGRAGAGPIRVWDEDDGPLTRERRVRLIRAGVDTRLGPWDDAILDDHGAVLVVKSPGIPRDAVPVRAALRRGLPVVDELDLGVRLSRRELIAVTGTDGKSTTCEFIARIAAGPSGSPLPLAGNTEFGEPLSSLPARGGPVVVEVSSYQLEFTAGAFPRLAVLTALTQAHLHRHGSMDGYAAAKRRLFLDGDRAVPAAVVNTGGPFGRALAGELRAAGASVASVGAGEAGAYRLLGVESGLRSAEVRAETPDGEIAFALATPGRHNAENALAALAACDLLGIPRERSLRALPRVAGVPGRWDVVDSSAPVDFVVDFAHTPAAVARVLECAREVISGRPGARLHAIVSAGGTTQQGQRGRIGRAAGELAHRVTVTEGSVSERPQAEVIAAVAAGARGGTAEVAVEPDRGAAIRDAVAAAAPGDLLITVGHGARRLLYSNRAGEGRPFADTDVAGAALAERFGA